jgi:hypothetical protein
MFHFEGLRLESCARILSFCLFAPFIVDSLSFCSAPVVMFSRNLSGVRSISSESAVNRFVHRDLSREVDAAASFLSVSPNAVTSVPDEGFVVMVGA